MLSSTPHQIKNNPSNNSTSKYQWSFSKSQRFKAPKSYCNNSCYEIPTTKSKRRASIGFGERTKYFNGKKGEPEPGKYQMKSDFQNKRHKNKGHSFTANRQDLLFNHFQKGFENTPPPFEYNTDSKLVKKKQEYSMRPKTAYPKDYFIPNKNETDRKGELPGPGKYETIDQFGKKYYTKQNARVGSFHGGRRFSQGKITPGPSDYLNKTIEPDGIYLLSNMKSSGRRAILGGKRNLKMAGNRETPGPGTYRAPSDFGHYDQPVKRRPSSAKK